MRRSCYLALLLVIAFVSCERENALKERSDESVQEIILTLSPFDGDGATKTSYDYDSKYFLWAEGDAVGIVSPSGNQLKFAIKPGDYGERYASFDGSGFLLEGGTSYSSYTPFYPNYDLDPTALPIHSDGQVQMGNNSYSHLGDYSYTVAMGTTPVGGKLNFVYRNVGSPHRYNIPVLPSSFGKFTLNIPSSKYTIKGTLNLNAPTETELKTISPTVTSNQLSLAFEETSMTETGELKCWLMVPPANLVGDVIHVIVQCTDGTEYVASVAGRDGPANNRRFYYAATSVYPANTKVGSQMGGNPRWDPIFEDWWRKLRHFVSLAGWRDY